MWTGFRVLRTRESEGIGRIKAVENLFGNL